MERSYQQLRSGPGQKSFVEPTIRKSSGERVAAVHALIDYFKTSSSTGHNSSPRRLWFTGRSGTGKTTLLEAFLRQIASHSTLRASWDQYHVIPLLLRVRDSGATEVIDAISIRLESYGIEGKKLVARLLRTGDFLLILDGANERDWDKAIAEWIEVRTDGVLNLMDTCLREN